MVVFITLAQTPTYQGLLWKISGNGLTKPSFLYGTMHVSNKVAFHLSDSFYKAIASVDVVSLEINPETWMETMTGNDYVADNMGNVFSMRSGYDDGGFYKSIFELKQPENKVIGAAMGAELGILNSLLYRTSNYSADFQEDTYLDLFIFQTGKKQGKEITGLEKLGATMKLNEIAEKPETDKKKLKANRETEEYRSHILSKILDDKSYSEVMENAYRLGDLDLLDSMSRMASTDISHKLIIELRNSGMADAMDSIMKEKSLFAGVGAAHLANTYGMINLLREKGYTVTPVSGDKTDYSNATKEKIEDTFIKQEFKRQTSFDGSFTVSMPGPLYEFPEAGNTLLAAYPDMANGATYVITRMLTFAPLHGLSQEDYLSKLDSLFFENIPGKIQEKKRITINGVPGFDIKNKTKKGDLQRYHIMVTPLEIIIFKAAGKKEFVNRPEVNQFFDQIQFNQTETWQNYSPSNKAYTVEMPGNLLYEAENNSFMRGYWKKSVQSYDQKQGYFAVLNRSYMDMEFMEEDTFELHQMAKFFCQQFNYEINTSQDDSAQGYTSYQVLASKENASSLHLKEIAVGTQYYLLAAQTDDAAAAERFFNSIHFNSFKFKRPFALQYDTARLFTVVSNVEPPADYGRYNRYYYDDDDEEVDDTHLDDYKAAVYYNKESDETIYVRMHKFHKYFYKEQIDSLWSLMRKEMVQDNFFVRSERYAKQGDIATYEVSVGDTATNRNLIAKHYLKHGAVYSLYTENNFKMPRSSFVDSFFTTFTPMDTLVGTPILENKVDQFLADLVGEDSTAREAAYNSFGQIEFKDKDVPKLIAAYSQNKNGKHSVENRASILENLGALKSPDVVPFLTKTYKEIDDSIQYQLVILQALAQQKTKKAAAAFGSLITDETPLVNDGEEIEYLFMPFYDSLDVAKELYPKVLMLTALDEYKMPVYQLLATLVDSNVIKPKVYKSHLKQLIWEANNEAKRQKGSEASLTADFYTEVNRNQLYGYNAILEYYAVLLQPYSTSQKTKKFYDRAQRLVSPGFQLDMALIKLSNEGKLSPDEITTLVENKNDRIVLYQRLKTMKRLNLYPTEYNNHDTLAMALYAQKARINQYRDSLLFVSKAWVSDGKDSGYMYFYKSKYKSEDWQYGYMGPIDSTEAEIERYKYDYDDDLGYSKYEDEALQIRKTIREYEMQNHPRYRVSDEPEFKNLQSKRRRFGYGGY